MDYERSIVTYNPEKKINRMSTYFQIFLLAVCMAVGLHAQAQNQQATLQIENVQAEAAKRPISGKSTNVNLAVRNRTNPVTLFAEGGTQVMAEFRVSPLRSRVSEHKNSGVRLRIHYTCIHNGRARRNMQERIFWMDDPRQFEEKVIFAFRNGIQTDMVTVSYKGTLPN